jgi:putative transposase
MPQANRYHLPGHVWHLTHRYRQREFFLDFASDRDRYRYWLFQATKRFGLCVLDLAITSNHAHLLVIDTAPNAIAQSLQRIAGRTAQEQNLPKGRKGAYWEGGYHAAAGPADGHLARCMAHIDRNMMRAAVVSHSEQWTHAAMRKFERLPCATASSISVRLAICSDSVTSESFGRHSAVGSKRRCDRKGVR